MAAMITETSMVRYNKHQIPDSDWNAAPLRSLIRHIVETHHAFLQTELGALERLLGRCAQRTEGGALAREVHRVIQHLKRDLELQMRKEETILFPAILDLETTVAAGGKPAYSPFGSIANLSRVTVQDNDKALLAMNELRELTNDYTCTEDRESAMPGLFSRLSNLSAELNRHFHLEKDILFPRAVDLETKGQSHCQ